MRELLKLFYSYFYRKVFRERPSFSDRDEKAISSFEKILNDQYGDSVNEEWLFSFLLFQFNKFVSADTKMKIQLNWIYGKKSLQSWRDRNKEFYEHFDNKFKDLYNLKRSDLINDNSTSISRSYQTRERNRFKEDIRKLLHCRELQLFDGDSADCRFCKVKGKCYAS